jgi:hypothetical protein
MINSVSGRDLSKIDKQLGRVAERDRNQNFFLRLDTRPYKHQWVAIIDNKVVAHGKKIGSVLEEVEQNYPKKIRL